MKLSWLLLANIVYALAQWGILVILARFFSQENVGEYFFALALTAPIALLSSLKLSNLVVTLEDKYTNSSDIFGSRLLLSLIFIFFTFIIYFVFFKERLNIWILSSVVLYKLLEQYDDIIISFYQKGMNFKRIFIVKSFRACVYTFLIYISILIFNDYYFSITLGTFVYLVCWIFFNKNYLNEFSFKFFNIYIKNGLYLSASSSLASLSTSGTRLYIGYTLGTVALSIYGVISYSLVAFSLIISALTQYFLPLFSRSKENKNKFLKEILKSQIIIFLICVFFLIFSFFYGNELLNIFYGSDYKEYGFFLFLVFLSSFFKASSSLIGTAMTALRIYSFQLRFTIISFIMTVILTPLFIFNFDILGAFLALLIVNILEWVLYIFFSKKLYELEFNK